MKRVMCGKMSVAYQNVEFGKAPNNVMYKVGSRVGQQQCGGGASDGSTYKVPNQADSAAWNIIALSMYLRSQSPESNNNSCLAPLSPLNPVSLRCSDGEKLLSPSSAASNLCSSFSSFGGADLGELRSVLTSDEDKRADSKLSSRSWSGISCSTESSDEEKFAVTHFIDHFGGAPCGGARLPKSSRFGFHENNEGPEVSSSSSSIGGCEDDSCSSREGSNEDSSGDMEVESSPRGPLHHMSALEASLPIKRGLSRFWNGKSRSFTCLADVTSMEELAKPENPYAKRRRPSFGDRHKSFPPLSRSSTAGISKRPTATSGSRSGLAVAVAMGSKLEAVPKCPPAVKTLNPSRSVALMNPTEARSPLT